MPVFPILVFAYHRVLPGGEHGELDAATFERQLVFLAGRLRLLSGPELLACLRGDLALDRPAAAITFDDGWLDTRLHAAPILRRHRIPAILALSTGYLHDGPCRDDPAEPAARVAANAAFRRALYHADLGAFLRRAEVAAMLDGGLWAIEGHGHLHAQHFHRRPAEPRRRPHADHWTLQHALGSATAPGHPTAELVSALATPRRDLAPSPAPGLPARPAAPGAADVLRPTESLADFRVRLAADLATCRRHIADIAGRAPTCLFWPWGHWTAAALDVAAGAGFDLTFGTGKAAIVPGRTALDRPLPRIGAPRRWSRFRRRCAIYARPWLAGLYAAVSPADSGCRD